MEGKEESAMPEHRKDCRDETSISNEYRKLTTKGKN